MGKGFFKQVYINCEVESFFECRVMCGCLWKWGVKVGEFQNRFECKGKKNRIGKRRKKN